MRLLDKNKSKKKFSEQLKQIDAGSVDWELSNNAASDWALGRVGELVRGITNTTRNRIRTEVANFVQNKETVGQLKKRLTTSFSPERAHMIAVTETTRAYAEGSAAAWKESGFIDGKRWNTNRDELVCPLCGPLDDEVVPLNDAFSDGTHLPPRHPRCRCWTTPVPILEEEAIGEGFIEQEPGEVVTLEPAQPTGFEAIERPKSGKYVKKYNDAVDSIESVHTVTGLETTPLKTKRMDSSYGEYRFSKKGSNIVIDPEGDELTVVHEIGHAIDHQSIMFNGRFDSQMGSIQLSEWQSAVRQTEAYQQLQTMQADPSAHSVPVTLQGNIHTRAQASSGKLNYLLDDREVFARSYSQYIAESSGNTTLLEQVGQRRADKLYGAQHWSSDDFAPVAQALDTMFTRLGWKP